ncbi:MAG: glycosyltransferase [Bacteroidales bacterium]|nr:glycosyltransferase [Bacteroidales bacterium]
MVSATIPLKRVYISVINDLVTDQRVHRVVDLLQGRGMEVTCIGRRLPHSPGLEGVSFRYRRYRMLFTKGPLFYACYNARLLLTLLTARKPSLFIANDLDTLPAGFMASRIRKVKLIYDSHELFTQVPELIHRKRVQRFWKWIEYWYVSRLEHAVTVNHSIAHIYRRLYKTRFRVVRNVPVKREPCPDLQVKQDHIGKKVIIYQGALNVGRGLELVIETMQYLENTVFMVVGSGDIDAELRTMVEKKNLGEKVFFKGRLSPRELFPLTCAADLGISLEEDRGLNYRYALPNKLFDYIQARVPVLCSALPEMARIVNTYGVGIATRERDPQKLARIIRYMFEERTEGAWREALDLAAAELCWENESRIYLELLAECGILIQTE